MSHHPSCNTQQMTSSYCQESLNMSEMHAFPLYLIPSPSTPTVLDSTPILHLPFTLFSLLLPHTGINFSLHSIWYFTVLPSASGKDSSSLHIQIFSSCSYLLEWQCKKWSPVSVSIFNSPSAFRTNLSLFHSISYSSLTASALVLTPSLPFCVIHIVGVCPHSSAASRQTSQTFHSPFFRHSFIPLSTSLDPFFPPSGFKLQRSGAFKKYSKPTSDTPCKYTRVLQNSQKLC